MNTIRRILRWAPAVALVSLLAATVGAAPPLQPEPSRAGRPLAAPSPMTAAIPIQGRITDATGQPLPDGSYDVAFEIYERDGTFVCVDAYPPPSSLYLEDGLFSAVIAGCPPEAFDGRQLDLQITVEGETLSPRQPLYASPYAWSLKPGATIYNRGTGRGLTVMSSETGQSGTTLWTENTNSTGGIAIWAVAAGNDASVISSNNSSGALFKGFGGDGGEDEFRVQNDGAIWSKADTFWHVPAHLVVPKTGSVKPALEYLSTGAVEVKPIAGTQTYAVLVPIALPALLYGGQVQIEGLTIYYKVSESQSRIDRTRLIVASETGAEVVVADLLTDQNSTTYTGYSPVANANLGYQSFVAVELTLYLWEDWSVITIGGVDVQLGHHPLY